MIPIRQGATITFPAGPYRDVENVILDELVIQKANVRLAKEGADYVAANADQGAADVGAPYLEKGEYRIALNATDTDTIGRMKVNIQMTGALDVFYHFQVLDPAVYDALIAGSELLAVNVTQLLGGDPGADTLPDNSIKSTTLQTDLDTYQAEVGVTIDDVGVRDRYTVTWLKNGQPVSAGITVPKIKVVQANAGATVLIALTAMTAIGATGDLFYDEPANRIAAGRAYQAYVEATIDGSTRTWRARVGRNG